MAKLLRIECCGECKEAYYDYVGFNSYWKCRKYGIVVDTDKIDSRCKLPDAPQTAGTDKGDAELRGEDGKSI